MSFLNTLKNLAVFVCSLLVYTYVELLQSQIDYDTKPYYRYTSLLCICQQLFTLWYLESYFGQLLCAFFLILSSSLFAVDFLELNQNEDPSAYLKLDLISFAIGSFIFWFCCFGDQGGVLGMGNDVFVKFKPFEVELRSALRQYSPNELHLVDNYLTHKKYRGRARDIIKFVEIYHRLPREQLDEYSIESGYKPRTTIRTQFNQRQSPMNGNPSNTTTTTTKKTTTPKYSSRPTNSYSLDDSPPRRPHTPSSSSNTFSRNQYNPALQASRDEYRASLQRRTEEILAAQYNRR